MKNDKESKRLLKMYDCSGLSFPEIEEKRKNIFIIVFIILSYFFILAVSIWFTIECPLFSIVSVLWFFLFPKFICEIYNQMKQ